MHTLRHRIAAETATHHDCVDAAFSALDLTQPEDFRRFLLAQHAAFAGIARRLPERADAHSIAAALETALAALSQDLAAMDAEEPCPVHPFGQGFMPLSVGYIFHGSRIGSAVLRARWRKSADPQVQGAGRYLTLPRDAAAWDGLLAELMALPAEGAFADRIVAEVAQIFAMFETALRRGRQDRCLNGHALVLEENPVVAMDTADLLAEMGASPSLGVSTIAEAQAFLDRTTPQLVILDANVGQQSAAPLARGLSARGVPYLLVSGSGGADLRAAGFPPAPLLEKPFDARQLRQALSRLLECGDDAPNREDAGPVSA